MAGRWIAGAMALVVLGGCMYARGGLVGERSRVLRAHDETRPEVEPVVRVRQEGTRVDVESERLCRAFRRELVETTRSYGRESRAPALMTIFAIAGAGAVGFGSVMAANVFGFPSDGSVGSTYEGLTMETGLLIGIGLIGIGAAGIVAALAHAFGLIGTDEEVTQGTVDREPSGRPMPCSPSMPMRGDRVSLLAGGEAIHIGTLGPTGALTLDAAFEIEPAFVLRHASESVPVRVGSRDSGFRLEMQPFAEHVEERVWARAEAARCAEASRADDCRGLERYLQLFPSGTHAVHGREVLDAAHARLAERAQRLEEERRAREEQMRAEDEARRREEERLAREEREQWEREQRARQFEASERERAAQEQAQRRQARGECERTCRGTCAGNAACEQSCRAQRCR